MPADDLPPLPREILFEFHQQGRNLRIVAIDPATGTEITMVGAPGYSKEALKRIAARKLAYVIQKKRGGGSGGPGFGTDTLA